MCQLKNMETKIMKFLKMKDIIFQLKNRGLKLQILKNRRSKIN